MIRIREISDPELKARVVAKLGELRGLLVVPEWFELDDADFVDLLNELREEDEAGAPERADDYRG